MEVIMLEERAFYELLNRVVRTLETDSDESLWVEEDKAMQILGIKSKTTLQRLRNEDKIRFSQPSKKIIMYYKTSLYEYLEAHSNL
jgi:hypothetical protein